MDETQCAVGRNVFAGAVDGSEIGRRAAALERTGRRGERISDCIRDRRIDTLLAGIGRDELSDHHDVGPQPPYGLKKRLGRRAIDEMKSAFARWLRAGGLWLEGKCLHLVAERVRATPPRRVDSRQFT